jgi:hypothetical protein
MPVIRLSKEDLSDKGEPVLGKDEEILLKEKSMGFHMNSFVASPDEEDGEDE